MATDLQSRAENDAADAALLQWLAGAAAEETLEPALPIIDPHHHMWLDGAVHHRYLMDELAADLNSGHHVVATVFVDCGSMYAEGTTDGTDGAVGETEFAQVGLLVPRSPGGGCCCMMANAAAADPLVTRSAGLRGNGGLGQVGPNTRRRRHHLRHLGIA
jgi:hypothetical protein